MAWQPGKTLRGDRYTIEEILGMGRFGITYLAREKNGNPVAIKTPNDEVQALNPAEFDRLQQGFVQEAVKLAKCRHPHIVRAEEPFQEDSIWCIAMEYIDGVSLARRATAKLPETEALEYVRQIGEALRVVHENGLLHRDVQPQNIIVRSGKPEAVLIDFGLARKVGEAITQTRTSEISDGFSPLELYSSQRECGVYTDIYALGATLYNLVTGERPLTSLDRKLGERILTPPQQINSKISDRLNRAILTGMELEAENRPQSMQAWLEMLPETANVILPLVIIPPPVQLEYSQERIHPFLEPSPLRPRKPKSSQPTRQIPWGALIAVIALYGLLGILLGAFPDPVWAGDLAGVVAWAVTFVGALVVAEVLAEALAGDGAGAKALAGVVAWVVAWAVAEAVTGVVVWAGAWAVAWALVVAVAWALVVAGKTLLKSFNGFQTFLILVATSGLGFGLGWLVALTLSTN